MKKIIRLTERDITRIVRRVIKENETSNECEKLLSDMEYVFSDYMSMLQTSPNEIDPEEFYDEVETELGGFIDFAIGNDCDDYIIKDMEESYGYFLSELANTLDLN